MIHDEASPQLVLTWGGITWRSASRFIRFGHLPGWSSMARSAVIMLTKRIETTTGCQSAKSLLMPLCWVQRWVNVHGPEHTTA